MKDSQGFIQTNAHQNLPNLKNPLKNASTIQHYNQAQKKKLMSGSTSKRGWTAEEDTILLEIVSQSTQDKCKWMDVSRQLYLRTGKNRTGKQCRERWQHQLNPSIVRNEWNELQLETLFRMQAEIGNKWAQIAAFFPGRTDNAVKNCFYSSVRRVLTKINQYLANQRNKKELKTVRPFDADFLSKLLAVADGKFQKRLRLTTPETSNLAKGILLDVSNLAISGMSENLVEFDDNLDSKILKMQQFRKCCKKRKQSHNFNDFEDQQDVSSVDDKRSFKDSSLNGSSSSGSFRKKLNEAKSNLNQNNLGQAMDIQSQKADKTSQSQKTIELEFSKRQFNNLQMKKVDSLGFRIPIFKGLSGIVQENKQKGWNYFQQFPLRGVGSFQNFEPRFGQECDIFSMPYRQDYLGTSRDFCQPQKITKSKMLQVSLALEQCLFKARKSSSFEQIKNSEYDL